MKKIIIGIVVILFIQVVLSSITLAVEDINKWNGNIVKPQNLVIIENVYYYKITMPEELAYIAKEKGEWLGYNYVLANDIVLNSGELSYNFSGELTVDSANLNEWIPIDSFCGIFDGNGFVISGVYVDNEEDSGFFTNLKGDLYNLKIKNSYVKGNNNVGGICSNHEESGKEFINCSFDGAVIGNSNVGGLIGKNDGTDIIDCINYADVFGAGDYVSGIVGNFYAYGIENCVNYGDIKSSGDYVAGIAGISKSYGIENCINYGDVLGSNHVAGICGKILGADIYECGNFGKIKGVNYVGGLCAYSTYDYIDSWESNIELSYNVGEVFGESFVGGITGYLKYADIVECYNVGNVDGKSSVGALIGHSESVWGKGNVSECYYFKDAEINTNIFGFGNTGDTEGIVRNKKIGFFPILLDLSANPSYYKLGYTNGEIDEPINNEFPSAITPETEDVWNGEILKPSVLVSIDNIYYYKIYTAKELAYIAINRGEWLEYNYILANDIVLNSGELSYNLNGELMVDTADLNRWVPIDSFNGIFDGNGYSISGLYVDNEEESGFFTNLKGDLYNLNIKNSYVKGNNNVGGICSNHEESGKEFINCSFDGAVIGNNNVGGLIGKNDGTDIIDCVNYSDVFGTGDYVSGIVGHFYAYGIENCVNYGNIKSSGNYVAGIAGISETYSIENCISYGEILGNNYVAGVCAYIEDSTIRDCYNVGYVVGVEYVGGIVAYCTCINGIEEWKSNIISSHNSGNVFGTTYVGGIAGYLTYTDVSNSYNIGDISGESKVGGIIGHSESIWGKGSVSDCLYLKTESVNTNINAFGNAPDIENVAVSQEEQFFCVNKDKTINESGHEYTNFYDINCKVCGKSKKVILGDLNDDKSINSTDLQRLYTHLNGSNIILAENYLQIADINGDGELNSTDLQKLYMYLSGRETMKY